MNGKSRFVWHDLNTNDLAGAQRFYGELFHWRCTSEDKSGYLHIHNGDKAIGGMRKLDANEGPPNWLGYVGVDDVAAAVTSVGQKGGKVIVPTQKIEKAGTFAVCADPTGAVFALWKGERAEDHVEPHGRAGTHNFCWDELLTTNVDKSATFFTSVFGWTTEKVDMGPGGVYTLLKRTGIKDETGRVKEAGGVWKSPIPHSVWMTYIAVDSADGTVDKAKRMGAKVMIEATDIPNVGRFAGLTDPQGANFAILQPKM
jgi:predicted enzyme related to lactoylglutathione lyase